MTNLTATSPLLNSVCARGEGLKQFVAVRSRSPLYSIIYTHTHTIYTPPVAVRFPRPNVLTATYCYPPRSSTKQAYNTRLLTNSIQRFLLTSCVETPVKTSKRRQNAGSARSFPGCLVLAANNSLQRSTPRHTRSVARRSLECRGSEL